MALNGTFILNGADYAPLTFPGVGTFMAFSGNRPYRNTSGCTFIRNDGPLPGGTYWIVTRPEGGLHSRYRIFMSDLVSGNRHNDWFALYRNDGRIDDYTWVNGVKRGQFRLHPIGRQRTSQGCLTVEHATDFYALRNALLRTPTVNIPGTDFYAFGKIDVVEGTDVDMCA